MIACNLLGVSSIPLLHTANDLLHIITSSSSKCLKTLYFLQGANHYRTHREKTYMKYLLFRIPIFDHLLHIGTQLFKCLRSHAWLDHWMVKYVFVSLSSSSCQISTLSPPPSRSSPDTSSRLHLLFHIPLRFNSRQRHPNRRRESLTDNIPNTNLMQTSITVHRHINTNCEAIISKLWTFPSLPPTASRISLLMGITRTYTPLQPTGLFRKGARGRYGTLLGEQGYFGLQ